MKKATETMTLEQVQKRNLTKAERASLKRLAAMPDDQIDTSDIPEVTDFTGWKRGPCIGRSPGRTMGAAAS